MRIYLQKQLEQQKKLLFLDIPALRSNKNFLSKLKSGSSTTTAATAAATTAASATCNNNSNKDDDNNEPSGSQHQSPFHLYANLNSRATDGSSSFDDLDDWEDNSSAELFELGALPTPASEQANVVVNLAQFFYILFFSVSKYYHFPHNTFQKNSNINTSTLSHT